MRQEDREKVMLRTQVCFQLGHHQSDYVYVSLQDVINDNIGTKIDKNIFSISINIGGEL